MESGWRGSLGGDHKRASAPELRREGPGYVLLTVDVGNTHTVIALFRGKELVHSWRLSSRHEATADELGIALRSLFNQHGYAAAAVRGLALATVVPSLRDVWLEIAAAQIGCEAVSVGVGADGGLCLDVERPADVGADRICDCVAAWRLYGTPVIVVDCGTATKIEAVVDGGRYVGGVIAPGIAVSSEALFSRAALLHRVDLAVPVRTVGRNTAEQVQAGIIFGFAGQVDALVERVRTEMGGARRVVATGGLCHLIAPVSRTITDVEDALTLHGLRLIYEAVRESAAGVP